MSKRAIRTSRKRVEAILARREASIRSEEYGRARRECDAHWKEQFELRITPDEHGDVWLGARPDRPRIVLAFPDRYPLAFSRGEMMALRSCAFRYGEVVFEAKQKMWRHPNGTVVRWVDWEPRL